MKLLPQSPYPLGEFFGMALRRFSEPPPFQQEKNIKLTLQEKLENELSIGFVGDICPIKDRQAVIHEDIIEFFDDCTLMVGNLEGVITDQPQRPFLLKHTPRIFDVLKQIKPLTKWTLSVANNHAMDYGDKALDRTINEIEKRDINWLGTVSNPTAKIADKITLTAWSWWMNGSTKRIHSSDPGSPDSAGLNIAMPHWGYEHERTPRQDQRENIPANYDMIVGHHSHLPQPLELVDDSLPVAWSLGNFLTAKTLKVLGEGAVMKAVINRPENDIPAIQSLDYRAILLNRDNPDECRVSFR
jgi:poly-gamma-glutamate capsule biosynthesis protein CapA/YwtB (metallophosphatase superfamily)